MSAESEPDIDGVAGAIQGIEIDWLYTSPSFGVTRWDCCRHGRRGLSEERIQLWHVISFVHQGAFVLHSEIGSGFVDRTTATLYNPDVPYRSTHPFGCTDHGSALVVRRDVLLDIMARVDPTATERPAALFPSALGRGLSRAYLRHRLLVRELTAGELRDPLAIEAALLDIVDDVVKACCRPAAKRRRVPRESSRARRDYVRDTQALLHQRFRERLRLEDVAKALYVSPFHLCRLFKEETGMPMHRYLTRLRLRDALDPVADGANLTELALHLGFSCHSHFTTAFRQEFGVPPAEIRRLSRRGQP